MPDAGAGPLSKCPVCGRTGLVGKEREIAGTRAVTVYKCHGCDNSWRVRDDDSPPVELPRREPDIAREPALPRSATGVQPRHRASPVARSPRVVILSVGRAEAYQPHGVEVCISITDPKARPVRLSRDFKAVLRLAFSDIALPTTMPELVPFAPEHAHEILDFVDQWPEAERIMIHCVAGLSRSPAIGMALCDLLQWPLGRMEEEYPLCNSWVRSELVRIGRERQSLLAKRASGSKGRTAKPRRPASRAKTRITKRTRR